MLEESIRTHEGNIESLEDHIDEMKQCVLEESLVMSASEQKVNRNTNLLNKSTSMCDAFQDEYKLAKESREEELELIETIRKMVNHRLSQFSGTSVDEGYTFDV
jgi:sugar-specific transcriptional regulator TrmB